MQNRPGGGPAFQLFQRLFERQCNVHPSDTAGFGTDRLHTGVVLREEVPRLT